MREEVASGWPSSEEAQSVVGTTDGGSAPEPPEISKESGPASMRPDSAKPPQVRGVMMAIADVEIAVVVVREKRAAAERADECRKDVGVFGLAGGAKTHRKRPLVDKRDQRHSGFVLCGAARVGVYMFEEGPRPAAPVGERAVVTADEGLVEGARDIPVAILADIPPWHRTRDEEVRRRVNAGSVETLLDARHALKFEMAADGLQPAVLPCLGADNLCGVRDWRQGD